MTSESASTTPRRPGSVTLVVVLTIISGVLTALGGLFLLLLGAAGTLGSDAALSGAALIFLGVIYLLIGLVTIAVGIGLRHGSRFARMLVTILMVIDIVGGIVALIWFQTTQTVTSSSITIIVSAIVLALLWNRRASEFFAR
jgi:hypothetical protein